MPTKYVTIGAVVLILAAALYFMFMGGSNGGAMNTTTDQTASASNDSENSGTEAGGTFSGSLADLVKRGGDYKCTFTHDSEAAQSSGTVYVSGTRVRGDFSSTVSAGMTVDSHMIQDGGYVYTWSSAAPYGFKAKATGGTQPGASGAPTGEYMDATQAYAYNCTPWSVDASMYTVPSGIQFMGQ